MLSEWQPAATGSVTGHVTCAHTNTPARLAIVVLRPVPAAKSADSAAARKPVEARCEPVPTCLVFAF